MNKIVILFCILTKAFAYKNVSVQVVEYIWSSGLDFKTIGIYYNINEYRSECIGPGYVITKIIDPFFTIDFIEQNDLSALQQMIIYKTFKKNINIIPVCKDPVTPVKFLWYAPNYTIEELYIFRKLVEESIIYYIYK